MYDLKNPDHCVGFVVGRSGLVNHVVSGGYPLLVWMCFIMLGYYHLLVLLFHDCIGILSLLV